MKKGYIPQYFDLYNCQEIKEYAPTQTTASNGRMGSGTILIIVDDK